MKPSLISRSPRRRDDSVYQQRFDARERRLAASVERCPDCNAALVSKGGVGIHKARGGCVVIPGARERLAAKIVAFLMGEVA